MHYKTRKKMESKKKVKHIIFHLAVWGTFFYIFIPNSFLRPYPFFHPYKEWIVGLILMSFCYINYFVLIPRLYLTGFTKKYWIVFLISILFSTFLEFLLITPDLILFKPSLTNFFNRVFVQSLLLVFIRNGGMMGLFFLLKTNLFFEQLHLKEHQEIIKKNNYYDITISSKEVKTINIQKIVYIQHRKNYTYFYLTDGSCYSQYISLLKVESELPEGNFVRINRSTLANTTFPSKIENGTLQIEMPNGKNVSLTVSPAYNGKLSQIM